MTQTTYKAGQKVRVLADTNFSGYKPGTIVELVEISSDYSYGDRFWLATTDSKVRRWTVPTTMNVNENDIEPVEFKAGDRVRRNGLDHMYYSTNYEHKEAPEGTLGTVTDWTGLDHGYVHVKWDTERGSVIQYEALDVYVPLTIEDVEQAIAAAKSAEAVVSSAGTKVEKMEAAVESAKAEQAEAVAAAEAAVTKRAEVIAAYAAQV